MSCAEATARWTQAEQVAEAQAVRPTEARRAAEPARAEQPVVSLLACQAVRARGIRTRAGSGSPDAKVD